MAALEKRVNEVRSELKAGKEPAPFYIEGIEYPVLADNDLKLARMEKMQHIIRLMRYVRKLERAPVWK